MKFSIYISLFYLVGSMPVFSQLPGTTTSDVDSLKSLLNVKSKVEQIDILNQLSRILDDNDPHTALAYAEEAKHIADSCSLKEKSIESLGNIAQINSRLGNIDSSIQQYRVVVNFLRNSEDSLSLSRNVALLGTVMAQSGKMDSSIFYLNEAYEISKAINNQDAMRMSLINKGVTLQALGQNALALDVYLQCLNNFSNTPQSSHGILLNNIGSIYVYLGNYDKALEYFSEFLDISIKSENLLNQDIAYCNIGDCYLKTGKIEDAYNTYNKALDIAENINDLEGEGILNYSIGKTFVKQQKYQEALEAYKKALSIFLKTGIKKELAITYRLIGELYLNKESYLVALKNFNSSLQILEVNEISDELIQVYEKISLTYDSMRNYKKSLEYFKKFKKANDALLETNNKLKIAELESQYEFQQRAKENVILRKENQLQKQVIDSQRSIGIAIAITLTFIAFFVILLYISRRRLKETKEWLNEKNQMLEELNATKDKFFSIIAHDLKNPFGSILNYTELLKEQFNEFSESEKKELVDSIDSSATKVHKLLDNLLTWARSQRGLLELNKQELDLEELIQSAIKPFIPQANHKKISIKTENVDKNIVVDADKFMLQTVVGNITNNAIKFSKPGAEIDITGKQDNNSVVLSITDQGIGIPNDIKENLFRIDKNTSTPGTQTESGSGLGLIICKEFMDKHGGKIEIESNSTGTTFTLKLPKI